MYLYKYIKMIVLLLITVLYSLILGYIYLKYFYKNPPIVISIDGNIGSGKSTLVKKLKKNFQTKDIIFIDEPVDEWLTIKDNNDKNILDNFYKDKLRWAYTFQNCAFITRAIKLIKIINNNKTNYFQKRKIIITERSVETDKNVFCKMLYNEKKINDLEYNLYNLWYDTITLDVIVNNVIYLRTKPENSFNRIQKRSRIEENTIEKSYIQLVHKYHDNWLSYNNNNYNICYLNGNEEFECNDKILDKYINKILTFIKTLY